MENNKIQLEEKLVGQIEGEFYVPSYQRGYRWDKTQVNALLNDIYENGEQPYCLQPIVVRKDEHGRYELIDGQQRLTTLYIIYQFMKTIFPIVKTKYSLVYETRKENADFFMNMDDTDIASNNIDFFFIHQAYQTVKTWFAGKGEMQSIYIVTDILKRFDNHVRVIWYELQEGSEADAIALFTRLNIGRIPLTNAELVKALFLCESTARQNGSVISNDRRLEISLQWDTIERELHDEDFWYFLTKKSADEYPTKIELLFDFIARKTDGIREQFFTFLFFNERRDDLLILWDEILRYFYRLKEWYRNDYLYHKIGYLIASGSSTIDKLMNATKDMRKTEMDSSLDEAIRKSIDSKKPYGELTYDNDYHLISNILLLFNVISLMGNGSGSRFPFKEFNNNNWSLEHIHAQHSLKLNTQEKWKNWLKQHNKSIGSLRSVLSDQNQIDNANRLMEEIDEAINDEHLKDVTFNNLSDRIVSMLSIKGESSEYVHSLSNMALLQCSTNSALNNSLFDVKRRQIVDLDSQGKFIPYCTKMVFMKYYTLERQNNVSFHFWGENDRMAYIAKMNEVLKRYLKEEISYGTE
ncbi:MAG: DUF262 domain-containing protein [Prevotella sp.]|nr:DUF262 domain-containing protein [Prevotella sp.]